MAKKVRNMNPTGLAVPTPGQIAWQDCEIGLFVHFDITAYRPGWDFRSFSNLPDPALFNPARLDTDQWMEAAKALGAKYVVFVAKHCSGFCQWQTDIYPYGLKQAPWRGGKGDVVRDFMESCRRYKMKPGLYASTSANAWWEVDNPGLVNRGKGGDPDKQARYVAAQERMLEELWGNYGELFEVWFDGGALPPEQGGPDVVRLFDRLQPQAMAFGGPRETVRWVGNEAGVANYPCWATFDGYGAMDRAGLDHAATGDPDGKRWLPGECDVPLRWHEWFWKPDEEHKILPLDRLMDMYYKSVGRNCNLLLNSTPGPDGLIPEADMRRYAQFGSEIRRRFGASVAETAGEGEMVELDLGRLATVDHVITMERLELGHRVREYVIEGLQGDRWLELATGASIGHKRIDWFPPVEVRRIRFRARKAVAPPALKSIAAYRAGSV